SKRSGRWGLRNPLNDSGVLHREKALGSDNVKPDRENEGGYRDEQRPRLVLQDPLQSARVEVNDALEHAFGGLIESALLRFRLVTEQLRAHHRRKGQRNHRRNQNRHGQSDRELAEQAPDDVAHEKQWDQDRDQGNRQRNDRETDLIGPFQRGL